MKEKIHNPHQVVEISWWAFYTLSIWVLVLHIDQCIKRRDCAQKRLCVKNTPAYQVIHVMHLYLLSENIIRIKMAAFTELGKFDYFFCWVLSHWDLDEVLYHSHLSSSVSETDMVMEYENNRWTVMRRMVRFGPDSNKSRTGSTKVNTLVLFMRNFT